MSDYTELFGPIWFTDPLRRDTDGDGLADGAEIANSANPTEIDTDNDGFNDFLEVLRDSDPTTSGSTPTWSNDTFIRRILPAEGALESVVASYDYQQSNSLPFANPEYFDDFEAKVKVTEIHSKSAFTRARLAGIFYQTNDGRHIFAEIGLCHTDAGLKAYYNIGSCGDSSCSNSDWIDIVYKEFPDRLNLSQYYTLRLEYDQSSNQFTFGFEGESDVYGDTESLPSNIAPPVEPLRMIGTRIGGISGWGVGSGGYVRALFDDVYVHDQVEGWILYDDFTGPRIDQDNWLPANEFDWQNWEFVRSIKNGVLQTELANYFQNQGNTLVYKNPESIGGCRPM